MANLANAFINNPLAVCLSCCGCNPRNPINLVKSCPLRYGWGCCIIELSLHSLLVLTIAAQLRNNYFRRCCLCFGLRPVSRWTLCFNKDLTAIFVCLVVCCNFGFLGSDHTPFQDCFYPRFLYVSRKFKPLQRFIKIVVRLTKTGVILSQTTPKF